MTLNYRCHGTVFCFSYINIIDNYPAVKVTTQLLEVLSYARNVITLHYPVRRNTAAIGSVVYL